MPRPTDSDVPLRGALVRAINDASHMPKIDEVHCFASRGLTEQDMVFIVPRGLNMLLMGGLTERTSGAWT
ncbi:MAG TPA: hypothetical protein VF526_05230, partial [Solirubrobacteraceae bacterium]